MSAQDTARPQSRISIVFLLILACFLIGRLVYLYLGDPVRFPINTIKVVANYKHITHSMLETILSQYREKSFFTLPVHQLYEELNNIPWTAQIDIERQWPDSIKITLKEKQVVATWNGEILTDMGDIIKDKAALLGSTQLPHLFGPTQNTTEVLKTYNEMNALLANNNLQIATLIQRDNHAWEAILANGIMLKLGKQSPIERTARFCKAYPVLVEHSNTILSVDLRYPKGMAVKWQPPEKTSPTNLGSIQQKS